MKSNKFGFTLGEVLVCIVIIGVIMALSMQSIKIVKASYTSLTYFAFKTVNDLVGEVYAGDYPNEKLKFKNETINSTVSYCKGTNGLINQILKPDNPKAGLANCTEASGSGNGSNTFCKAVAAIANTTGHVECNNLFPSQYSATKKEPYITITNYNNPTFIATNGMRYYISQWNYDANVSNAYGYRLIAVDLNGKSKPNLSDASTNSRLPDIVTFLVLDNGQVLPLGVAADNVKLNTIKGGVIKYLNSKVKGYYYAYDKDRTTSVPQECTMNTKNGNVQSCNYAVVYVQNPKGEELSNSVKDTMFSYREAYCATVDPKSSVLTNYCSGIEKVDLCPPSTSNKKFDLCLPENIKPMFRYNFK